MAHIEVEKLCKTINKSIVLEDINLDMSSGKVYGFQGINGSGKTMLMRALIGLMPFQRVARCVLMAKNLEKI